jgi:hypothetical protein
MTTAHEITAHVLIIISPSRICPEDVLENVPGYLFQHCLQNQSTEAT